jgi:hypothetical protein
MTRTRTRYSSLFAAALIISLLGLRADGDSILNLGIPTGTVGETAPVQTSGSINGALFYRGGVQPAGTGVLDSFLRIQTANANTTFEHGYNTSNGAPLDDKAGAFTHDIQISDLKVSWINDVSYYGFLLDVGEPASAPPDPYISLVNLKIFQSSTGNRDDFNVGTKSFSGASLAYDLGGTNRVDINYLLSGSGNGQTDMALYVPTASFDPALKYIYLYSAFGGAGTQPPYFPEGSYEEWATASATGSPPSPRPEPVPLPTAVWGGLALLSGVGASRLRRKRDLI